MDVFVLWRWAPCLMLVCMGLTWAGPGSAGDAVPASKVRRVQPESSRTLTIERQSTNGAISHSEQEVRKRTGVHWADVHQATVTTGNSEKGVSRSETTTCGPATGVAVGAGACPVTRTADRLTVPVELSTKAGTFGAELKANGHVERSVDYPQGRDAYEQNRGARITTIEKGISGEMNATANGLRANIGENRLWEAEMTREEGGRKEHSDSTTVINRHPLGGKEVQEVRGADGRTTREIKDTHGNRDMGLRVEKTTICEGTGPGCVTTSEGVSAAIFAEGAFSVRGKSKANLKALELEGSAGLSAGMKGDYGESKEAYERAYEGKLEELRKSPAGHIGHNPGGGQYRVDTWSADAEVEWKVGNKGGKGKIGHESRSTAVASEEALRMWETGLPARCNLCAQYATDGGRGMEAPPFDCPSRSACAEAFGLSGGDAARERMSKAEKVLGDGAGESGVMSRTAGEVGATVAPGAAVRHGKDGPALSLLASSAATKVRMNAMRRNYVAAQERRRQEEQARREQLAIQQGQQAAGQGEWLQSVFGAMNSYMQMQNLYGRTQRSPGWEGIASGPSNPPGSTSYGREVPPLATSPLGTRYRCNAQPPHECGVP